jgi:hypothetical protein
MFFGDSEHNVEKTITKHDLSIQELLIRIDSLDREVKVLLSELNISPEKLSVFVDNQANFTEENWQELQKQRQLLDEKLSKELSNIRDPRKVKKHQDDRHIQRHWLFVR